MLLYVSYIIETLSGEILVHISRLHVPSYYTYYTHVRLLSFCQYHFYKTIEQIKEIGTFNSKILKKLAATQGNTTLRKITFYGS